MSGDFWKGSDGSEEDNRDEHWLPQWNERPRKSSVRSLDDTVIRSIEKQTQNLLDSRLFRSMVVPTVALAGIGFSYSFGYEPLHARLTENCETLAPREHLLCTLEADRTVLNYSWAGLLLLVGAGVYFYRKDRSFNSDFKKEATKRTVDAIIDETRPRNT